MKLKSVATGYVFEAHDDAANELLERGDYVKAGGKEVLGPPIEPPPAEPPKRQARRRKF